MQNLAPTTVGNIIKPVYYAYPHEFNGATFSGLVVNYIGYSVSSATSSTSASTTAVGAVGSIFASPVPMSGNIVDVTGASKKTDLKNFYINCQNQRLIHGCILYTGASDIQVHLICAKIWY